MEHCRKCKYWRPMHGITEGGRVVRACHYSIDTGRLRGCTVEECREYESGKKKRRNLPREN